MSAATLRAQYPGRCTCGATFQAGALIAWAATIRRATVCPACAPLKAKRGPCVTVGTITAAFYVDAAGGIVACVFSDATNPRAVEVYRLRGGGWEWHGGRAPVFASPPNVEAWRSKLAV